MAVELPLTGAGAATANVATEQIGGAEYQLVKPAFGGDGVATKVSATDPLPVTDAAGATASKQDTIIGHLDGVESLLAVPSSAAVTSINDSAASQTLLAANAARKGATIFNDSTVALYVKFGTTASPTDFTAKMDAQGYYEVPFGYTGRIDGIWASDAAGAARVTELT